MQGLKTESKTFGEGTDHELRVDTTQLRPMLALPLLARLSQMLGPALGALGGSFKGDDGAPVTSLDELHAVDFGMMLEGIGQAFKALDPEKLIPIAIQLLAESYAVEMNDKGQYAKKSLANQGTIDLVFSGRLSMFFEVVAHAAVVNYGDFFSGEALNGVLAKLPTKRAVAITSAP